MSKEMVWVDLPDDEQDYSGPRDYSVGSPRKNGYNNQRQESNSYTEQDKAEKGLTFKEPM